VAAAKGEAAGSPGVLCLRQDAGSVSTVSRNRYLLLLERVGSVRIVTGSSSWQRAASLGDGVQAHLCLPV